MRRSRIRCTVWFGVLFLLCKCFLAPLLKTDSHALSEVLSCSAFGQSSDHARAGYQHGHNAAEAWPNDEKEKAGDK